MKYFQVLAAAFILVSCQSTTKNTNSQLRDSASVKTHPVPMGEVSIEDVCQYEQSGKQNEASCSKTLGKPVKRELHREYPSVQPHDLQIMAEEINAAYAKKSAELAEALKASGKDNPEDINSDSRRRLRLTHSKGHTCAVGELKVAQNVPKELQVGIFSKPNSTYTTISRFANGTTFVKADKEPDARSQSLKIIGAGGEKYIYGSENTMDFIMNQAPVFIFKSPMHFTKFFTEVMSYKSGKINDLLKISNLIVRFKLPLLGAGGIFADQGLDEAKALKQLAGTPPVNLLKQNYYSGIPLMWGKQAVKVRLHPTNCIDRSGKEITRKSSVDSNSSIDKNNETYYKTALREQMEIDKVAACWDLQLQVQSDPWKMPIEDTTIEWSEELSPFVTIGHLRIKPQKIDETENLEKCESLSYNAWRLPKDQIRPMGDLAKLRGMAYYMSAVARRTHNKKNFTSTSFEEPDQNTIKLHAISPVEELENWN